MTPYDESARDPSLAGILVVCSVALTSGCELGDGRRDGAAAQADQSPRVRGAAAAPDRGYPSVRAMSPRPPWSGRRTARCTSAPGRSMSRRLNIDSFVVVTRGMLFLSRGELWFTDLEQGARHRPDRRDRLSTTRLWRRLAGRGRAGFRTRHGRCLRTSRPARRCRGSSRPATERGLRAPDAVVLRSTITRRLLPPTRWRATGSAGYGSSEATVAAGRVDATTRSGPADGRRSGPASSSSGGSRNAFYGLAIGTEGGPGL